MGHSLPLDSRYSARVLPGRDITLGTDPKESPCQISLVLLRAKVLAKLRARPLGGRRLGSVPLCSPSW